MRSQRLQSVAEIEAISVTQAVAIQLCVLQEKEPHVEGSTFSFSGRSYYLHKLVKLPDLAQRLQAAIPACAASAVNLRKALVLISEIMDKVFLWREQVIHSFEELTTAISGDLWAMVCLAMSRCKSTVRTQSNSSDFITYALWR